MSFPLIVARDRGHVKSLRDRFLGHEIITASAFFDIVRLLAFIHDPNLRRDDHAVAVFLSKHLATHKDFRLHSLHNFSSLYSACYHGTKTPTEIYQAISGANFEFAPLFLALKTIDEAMAQSSLVNAPQALYRAWRAVVETSTIPFGLRPEQHIELFYLVDLTLLEIEVLKALSRLGIRFTLHFPLDTQQRGINAAVDFVAKQFESSLDIENIDIIFEDIAPDGPLKPLVEGLFLEHVKLDFPAEQVSICTAHDVLHEAELMAQKVAWLKTHYPDETIAIAVRTLDERSTMYARALRTLGVPVRDRKGISLLDSAAGVLLMTLLSAKARALSRKDVVGLINHPLFAHGVRDEKERSLIVRLLDELGIDNRVLVTNALSTRYSIPLKRLAMVRAQEDELASAIILLEQWLLGCQVLLDRLADNNSLGGHLNSLVQLIDEAMVGEDPSIAVLKKVLEEFACSKSHTLDDPTISFGDMVSLISSQLSQVTVPRPDYEDVAAPLLLPLPELLGKTFDHVFILDIRLGAMPKNTKPDPLMNDQARIMLNSHLKMPLLRVFFDDPFEPLPVPPRQALEPLWFVGAIASAQKSVHFSCADRDETGQEQAKSEFFLWLLEHVHVEQQPNAGGSFTSLLEQQFLLGIKQREHASTDLAQALLARGSAFLRNEVSQYAFLYDHNTVKESFLGRLDDEPSQSLTPSFIEAFMPCRFRGFMERLIVPHHRTSDADDIDPMTLGQIAHRVLELFFSRGGVFVSRLVVLDMITNLVHQVSQEHTTKNYVRNPTVLWCHGEWLIDALVNLIERMALEPWYRSGHLVAYEKSFGLGKSVHQGLRLTAHDRTYLLGGRIDRIDSLPEGHLVTDYKLSSVDALKIELSAKNFMVNSVQLPIYVRLAQKNIAALQPNVSCAYASIRDAEILLLTHETHPELYQRIFDDEDPQSLPHVIDNIFAPIKRGEIVATAGDHCAQCDFSYVCRHQESMHHGS